MKDSPYTAEGPRMGDRLFQSSRTDWPLNACITSYWRSMSDVAHEYAEAAEALANVTMQRQAVLDAVISPIVFLYRQYLELAMKDLIFVARQVAQEDGDYPKHHRLGDLWRECDRLIKKHYGPDTPPEIQYIQPLIDEWITHDPESFAFRYPTDRKGNPTLRGIKNIHLGLLYDTMKRLRSFLGCISADFHKKYDYICEYRYEEMREMDYSFM